MFSSLLVLLVLTFPSSLLLSAVSAEDTQARTDRVLLTPWVKFLWEAYRSVLDLLRNNAKVEKIYHEVAKEGTVFRVLVLQLTVLYVCFPLRAQCQ